MTDTLLDPPRPLATDAGAFPSDLNIVVVGTGGTGGYVVQYLSRLLYALSQHSPHRAWRLTLVDGDAVEAGNLLRQHFLPQDIGQPKATVLAERFGAVYQIPVFAVPTYLTAADGLDALMFSPRQEQTPYTPRLLDVIIGCVDNHATRQVLDQIFHRFAHGIYIDAGNDGINPSDDPADREAVQASGYGGHVVVGVKQRGRVLLPPVGTVYPDILTDTQSALPGQACGQQAVSQPQRMLTNVWAAMTVMSALNTLLTDHQVLWHVANFNARYGTTRSQALTATYWTQLASGA